MNITMIDQSRNLEDNLHSLAHGAHHTSNRIGRNLQARIYTFRVTYRFNAQPLQVICRRGWEAGLTQVASASEFPRGGNGFRTEEQRGGGDNEE